MTQAALYEPLRQEFRHQILFSYDILSVRDTNVAA